MKNIFLSCVIPVYGAEKYLPQCLESILNNPHYSDIIEVIAINDESPDSSREILEEYKNKYVNLTVVHQKNSGGAIAINRGLDMAKGEYVMIMDNDDYLSNDALDIFINNARKHSPDVIATKIIKKWESKQEDVFDTKYITELEILKAHQKPAIMNDGMYLGKAFKRTFLNNKKIRMVPKLLYADRPFVLTALACANKILLLPEITYYWRQREDSNNLSITDNMFSLSNLEDRIRSIRIIKFELASRGFDYWLDTIDYFNYQRIFWTIKKYNFSYLRSFAKVTRPYFNQINLAKMKNITPTQSFVIENIKNHTDEVFAIKYINRIIQHKIKEKYNRFVDGIDNLSNFIKNSPKAITKSFLKLLGKHSDNKLKNLEINEDFDPELIVFESNFGKSYSGNPKYIYEELLRQNRAMRAVWVYQGKEKLKDIPGNVIQVHRGTEEYFRYLARAAYWVNNIRFTVTYKPKRVTYLQTWHGTPLKRLGLDIEVSGPEIEARESFLKESACWDYLIAQNTYSKDIFKRAFAVQGEILVNGYPANDSLLKVDSNKNTTIKNRLNIPKEKKVILYAPTWRDDARKGNTWSYNFDLQLDLNLLQSKLGEDYVILLRLHHLISDNLDLSSLGNFVIDVSKYNDTSEILSITDIMITDYSSIFFDFMTTKRPILFYMYDLDKYQSALRGFYLDVHSELPGPVLMNTEQIADTILNIKKTSSNFKKRYNTLYDKYCGEQEVNSAELIVNKVFSDIPKLNDY